MKTKYKCFGKSAVSVVLSIMMLLSTMIVGEIGTIEAGATEIAYALIGSDNIYRLGNSNQAGWNWTNYNNTTNFRFNEHYDSEGSKPYISVRMPNLTYFAVLRSNSGTYVYGPDVNDTEITTVEQGDSGERTTRIGVSSENSNRKGFKFVDTALSDGATGEYRIHFDNTKGDKWFWINRLYKINTTNDHTKGTLTITTDYPEDNADSSGNIYAQNGESVTFNVTPNNGYTATATLDGSPVDISGGSCTLDSMPHDEVNFVVTYTENNTTTYQNEIIEKGASGGIISYSSSLAGNALSTVTVTTPPTNYRVYSMTAINTTTKAVISTVYSNTMTYKMPESDVKVYVTYKQVNGFWVTGNVKALGGSGSEVGWNSTTSVDTYLYYVSATDSYRDVYLTNNQYFTVRNSFSQYGPNPTPTIYANGAAATVLSSNNDRSCNFGSSTGNYRVHYNPTDHKIWVKSIYQVTTSGTTTNAVVGSRYVESGETATVTVYPPSDKYPTITVGGTAVPMTYNSTDGSYTAETTAGSAAVTFNISYSDTTNVTAHTNSYTESGIRGGTVTFSPSGDVRKNTYVEMSVTPPSGYTVSSVSINSGSVTATSSKSGSATVYKYAMPDTNVTAAITYAEKTVADGMIYFDNFTHWSSVNITIGDTSVSSAAMTEDDETGLYYFDATSYVDTSSTYTVTFSGSGNTKSFTFEDEDDYQKVYTPNGATEETPDEYLNITIADEDINNYIYFKANQYSWSPYNWYMAYMWYNNNDSIKNAEYPGVRMKKVSGYNDLYAIEYNSSYDRVIFNDGTMGTAQTDSTGTESDHPVFYQENHKSKTVTDMSSNVGKIWYPSSNTYRNIEGSGDNEQQYVVRNGGFGDFPTADSTSTYIRVYAKTGTIRSVSGASNAENGTYDKYSYYSDIDISYCDANGNATTTVTNDTSDTNYMKKNFDSTLTYTVGEGDSATTHYRLLKADVKRNRYIKVTLTIHDSTAASTYYVRGFNVNGKTYGEYTEKTSNNQYSFVYEVKDETVPIEITPVYFYQNDSSCINFEVEQFDTVESVWGNTVACYAYYVNGSNLRDHATKAQATLGGYPGQPLLNHQGIYFTQIPKTDAMGGKIKGITLNNYVWDAVHGGDLIGYAAICGEGTERTKTARNAQTYDYDDFVALANVSDVDTIIFNFKYRTFNQNGSSSGNFVGGTINETDTLFDTTKFGNEWNGLVDISNVPVDLFGNKVEVSTYKAGAYNSTAAVTSHDNYTRFGGNHHYFNEDFIKSGIGVQDKVYIVSDGYVNYYKTSNSNPLKSNATYYLGEYATMWYVYTKDNSEAQSSNSTYTLVGKLPPSAFITDFALESRHFTTTTVNGETVTILNPNLTGDNIPTKFLQYTKGLGGDDTQYSTGNSARNAMWTQYANIYNAANGMPAVITYESSLTSKGRDGATENPGNRSDGRWYYSRSTDVIPVTADIQVWIKQPDGTYVKDTWLASDNATPPVASKIVGAAPHFTNDSSYKGTDGNAFTNLNKATVRKASDKDFTFTTEGYKVGSDYTVSEGVVSATANSTATYTFVGWYLNLDGDNLSPITTTSVSSAKSMSADSTLVAVYEKVDTTKQTLVVSHELYANAPTLTTAKADPHNGSGTPHVQIVITDASGNTLKTYSDTTGSYQIKVENETLLQDTNNKVKIILTTETDSATTIYDVYRKRDDGDRYLKSGLNESNTYNWSEASQADASDNYSGLSGTIGGTLASKSVTYTYSVSDLFPSGTTVRTLNYYSDPQAKEIEVEVHYYDRDTSYAQFGKPTEISSDDKKVTFTAEMTDNTLESFVANNLDRFNVTENVVDQHYFEFSQYRAVKALKEFKYYPLLANDDKVPTTAVGEQQKYSYFFSGSYTPDGESTALPNDALNYHTSCYGIPQYDAEHCVDSTGKENPTDQEKLDARQQWVTFYNGTTVLTNINFQEDIDNAEITSITSANSTNDLSNVTKIVIWAFNAPKTYTFEAHYTKETTDQEENVVYPTFTEGTNKVTLNDNSTVYIDMSAAEPISGFYNQRVGSEDTREGLSAALKDSINGGTEYLKAYGIENAYFGGSEVSIEAAEKANLTGSDTILKFDAWYIKDSDGFHRLSTQRSYENRVMNDLIIYAGYVPSDETTDSVGVAITENETDRYIDTDNVEKVRYNTLVNVFGNGVTESDEHIVNAASVYVYLPQYDTDGHYIDWTDKDNKAAISEAFADPATKNKIRADVASHLTKLENARAKADLEDNSVGNYYHTYSTPATEVSILVNGITISTKGTGAKIDCFDFEIVSDNASAVNHQLTLTNKNRVQFSMIMLADDYDTKPFLAFVAIKYSKDGSSQWYVSDNFVSNLIDTDPSVKKN